MAAGAAFSDFLPKGIIRAAAARCLSLRPWRTSSLTPSSTWPPRVHHGARSAVKGRSTSAAPIHRRGRLHPCRWTFFISCSTFGGDSEGSDPAGTLGSKSVPGWSPLNGNPQNPTSANAKRAHLTYRAFCCAGGSDGAGAPQKPKCKNFPAFCKRSLAALSELAAAILLIPEATHP